MTTAKLTDRQWERMLGFLRQDRRAYVGNESRCRRFVEAVLWIDRSGAQWRFLPEEYGHWNSVYKRFARWCDAGVWARMLSHFAHEPDMENGLLDSTIVRAHACAAGAAKKTVARPPKHSVAAGAASAPSSMSPPMAWRVPSGCRCG